MERGDTGRAAAAARAALAAMVLVATGCLEERKPLGGQCALSSECDAPLVCRLERCRRECASARDCPPDTLCVEDANGLGACTLPEENSCGRNSDCVAPLMCLGGACREQCAADRDCAPGAACEDGACVDGSERSCVVPRDCAPPLVCALDGRCRFECRADRDCPEGQGCTDGVCEALPVPDDGGMDGGTGDGGIDGSVDGSVDASTSTDGGVNLPDDPTPCTGDGMCGGRDFAAGVCAGGFCGYVCSSGFGECNGDDSDGCETSVATDATNCGVCGNACPASTPVCLDGACVDATVEELGLGRATACARWSTGQVTCWGYNRNGEVGAGLLQGGLPRPFVRIPVMVSGIDDAIDLSVGLSFEAGGGEDSHLCVVRSDGTVWCWGHQDFGETGQGAASLDPLTVPTQVPGLTDVAEVESLATANCARQTSGQVLCWGQQEGGRLGNGMDTSGAVASPTAIPSLTDATELFGGRAANAACVRRSDGSFWCWGRGALGNGVATDTAATPVEATALAGQGIDELFVSQRVTFGRNSTTNDAYCWGETAFQAACTNTMGEYPSPTAEPMPFGDQFSHVMTLLFLRPDGALVCRGANTEGQCGNGVASSVLYPEEVVTAIPDATLAQTSWLFSCVVRNGTRIECAGKQSEGQLGAGTAFGSRSTFGPVQGAAAP